MTDLAQIFRIELPDQSYAEVKTQDDGRFAVLISNTKDAPDGAYRSAWNIVTFADAVRNIMDVVWESVEPFTAEGGRSVDTRLVGMSVGRQLDGIIDGTVDPARLP